LRDLRPLFLTVFALLGAAHQAVAAPDFYGVKMKSEDFAQDVFLIEQPKIPDFTNQRPGTDKRVYAYGYMSSFLGGGKGIAIEVFNHSDAPLATDKLFRELTVVTYSGERYDRAETEMMWSRRVLKPGQRATFNFKFPGVRIHKDEVRLIICSFDMGQTTLFLFPLRPPEKTAPAPESDEAAKKEAMTKALDKMIPPQYPLVKPEQIIEGVRYQFSPDFRKEVQGAQKDVEAVVYRDRPWSLDKPDRLFEHLERTGAKGKGLPRREAKVLIVNKDYGFVVVDAGFENGFGKNVILDVFRAGRRVGKVMVTKPRDKMAGAVVLPEWRTRDEIRVGDIVGMSV
jgi:hypothetical protein